MIASERRVTNNSPGAGAVSVVGNGLQQRGSSAGVNQILNSGRAVKIYVIDPRKFQERLEKYVGGLKDVEGVASKKSSVGAVEDGNRKKSIEGDNNKKIDRRNNNNNIIVDLTDDDVIIEEERLVSKTSSKGVSKLPVIAPAPASGIRKEKDPIVVQIQNEPKNNQLNGKPDGNITNVAKPKKKSTKKKATKKKKAPTGSSNVRRGSKSEDKMEVELAFLRKETTTRTGRVSKSPGAAAAAAAAAASAVNGALGSLNNVAVQGSQPSSPSGSLFICSGPNSRVPSPCPSLGGGIGGNIVCVVPTEVLPVKKKRVPPEMFRCVTCNKFYVGFAKFNAHFAKFPDHIKSDAKKGSKKRKTEEESTEIPILTKLTNLQTTDPKTSLESSNLGTMSLFSSNSQVEIQTAPSTNINAVNTNTNNNHLSSFSVEGTNTNNFQHSIALAQSNLTNLNSDTLVTSNSNNNNKNAAAHQVQLSTIVCSQQQSNIVNSIHSSEILQSTVGAITSSCTSAFSSGYHFVNQSTQQQTSFLHSSSLPIQQQQLHLPSTPDSPAENNIVQSSSSLNLPLPSSLNVNEDTISGTGGRDDFFLMDFNPHISEISQIPSELLGQGSCSQQSFNSLENLLADSNSQSARLSPSTTLLEGANEENANGPGLLSSVNNRNNLSSNGCINRSTFFSLSGGGECPQHQDGRGGDGPLRNSVDNISSYEHENVNNNSIVLPVDEEESRDLCINVVGGEGNESRSGCELSVQQERNHCGMDLQQQHAQFSSNSSIQRRKSIWEFVKEQIRLCGINQACGEISEMAEKLSKVARDKFYPIREEEIERMNGSPPIIQVETPFISHLLDLPFGTYIFKEDGGIRKVIPPPTPISSEISLTNGVEVDVDKFLSPDFDLISLPHLTNLDFTSICNTNDN